ncbi:MAG TPA: DUF6306 domain-containing protein [Sphingomonadaceae bacterium]|nr:DUF6306 domain-containing protein [Sphingomonadaceae bacterium]
MTEIKTEMVAALDELLEAERAGTRVALASAKGVAADSALGVLIHAIHHDEARWCAMLSGEITRLGATPSPRCGAFFGKAMAIDDLEARLTFLNRGQNWVVRKLDALMPLAVDPALHAHLADMRASHVDNIERTARTLAALPDD